MIDISGITSSKPDLDLHIVPVKMLLLVTYCTYLWNVVIQIMRTGQLNVMHTL